MKPWLLALLALTACAPLRVGPWRVLPPALQYEPAVFEGAKVERKVKAARRLTLPNGLEIFWAEDHAAPLVDVTVLVGCGRGDEPIGVPELTAETLHLAFFAGAGGREGADQRRAHEEVGLEPNILVDDGESWATFTVPTGDLPAALALVKEALGAPRFEATSVTRWHERWAARFDTPERRHQRLARQTRSRAIYGNVPSLSQVGTASSVRAITPELLRAHARSCLQAANLVLSISGDVTDDSLEEALAPLAALPAGQAVKHLPAPPLPTARWLWLVPSALSNKVTVEFVGPGLPPGKANRAAAEVLMAGLLGRLQAELRGQAGHIYSISGDIEVGPGSGVTWVRFTTHGEVVLETVERALLVVQRWWDAWPFDEELTKKVVTGRRKAFARSDAAARTFQAARARLQDRDAFDARPMNEQLSRVTMDDVRAIYARALNPSRLQVIVSGAFDPTLDWEQFGPATRVMPVP